MELCLRRSSFSRRSVLVLTFLIVCTVVVLACLLSRKDEGSPSTLPPSLDPSVHPCDDFYQFTCGKWTPPNGTSRTTAFGVLQDSINSKKKDILWQAQIDDSNPRIVNDAITFYQSCVGDFHEEQPNLAPILEYLSGMGGFPALNPDRWNASEFDWVKASAYLLKTSNIHTAFGVVTGIDDNNSSRTILHIGPPRMIDDTDMLHNFFNSEFLSIFFLLGNSTSEDIYEDIHQISETESRWKIFTTAESDPKRVTLNKLSEAIPSFDWLRFVQLIVNDTVNDLDFAVTGNSEVMVENFIFLKHVVETMNAELFPKTELANLFSWFVLRDVQLLVPGLAKAYFRYSDVKEEEFNELAKKDCVEKTSLIYPYSVDYLFVRSSSPSELLKSKEIVAAIHQELQDAVKYCDWLDAATRNKATAKINSMQYVVGYDELLNNKEIMEAKFSDYPHPAAKALQTYLTINSHRFKKSVADLKPDNGGSFETYRRSIMDVSAYYILQKNIAVFPLSLHFPPFYHTERNWFMNFGSLGSIVGHEMMHAFDLKGSKRDGTGTLKEWWTNSTWEKYRKNYKCFEDQYSIYKEVENATLRKTSDEDVADVVGLNLAFKAYQKWTVECGSESSSLNYSPEQLFFVAFATNWCQQQGPLISKSKDHSSNKDRVNGAVSNSHSFAEVFNCPEGAPMNPEIKCSIW